MIAYKTLIIGFLTLLLHITNGLLIIWALIAQLNTSIFLIFVLTFMVTFLSNFFLVFNSFIMKFENGLLFALFALNFNLWIALVSMDFQNIVVLIGLISTIIILLFYPHKIRSGKIIAIGIGFFSLVVYSIILKPSFNISTNIISYPIGKEFTQQWILDEGNRAIYIPRNCQPLKIIDSKQDFQFVYNSLLPDTISIDSYGNLGGHFDEEIQFEGDVDLLCGLMQRFPLGKIIINSTITSIPLNIVKVNEFISWTPDIYFYGYWFMLILLLCVSKNH